MPPYVRTVKTPSGAAVQITYSCNPGITEMLTLTGVRRVGLARPDTVGNDAPRSALAAAKS
jgi:hypothetical protein